ATLFVGVIDLSKRTLTYCSAGHPPAILLRARRRELQMLDVQSGVVGAFREMTYRNGTVTIGAGDVLLLYTDGTTEARARDGRFFGEDGLRDAVVRHASVGVPGLCDCILSELDTFTERTLEDDVALVALRFDEVGV
ncbi:MAG: serine/threonine-protein phosphatase, partial [Atopobiaceae bacterium]|nr:serine/threonine-protein phosphatase [Atopobiaceae bacterium]